MTFSQQDAKKHNSCVTEHQKYAEGATKPGGIAANRSSNQATPIPQNESQNGVAGLEFLSTGRPWSCRCVWSQNSPHEFLLETGIDSMDVMIIPDEGFVSVVTTSSYTVCLA